MEAIKKLSIELLKASDENNIAKCLEILKKIKKILKTYEKCC